MVLLCGQYYWLMNTCCSEYELNTEVYVIKKAMKSGGKNAVNRIEAIALGEEPQE